MLNCESDNAGNDQTGDGLYNSNENSYFHLTLIVLFLLMFISASGSSLTVAKYKILINSYIERQEMFLAPHFLV